MVLRTPAVMLPKFCKIMVVVWIYLDGYVDSVFVIMVGCCISIAPPGPGCLGFGGATGGIRARGLEALGSEGSGFGLFWFKIGLSRVACILVL